ncbi:CpsD/CapB family tyrosine-protein kinase, partial [bacterium]|nr:CpsD/CapB family tyrosine-protein kinase [bacterium]
TGASAPADEHTPITPRVDSQGNTVVSEDTVEQHEHNGELVRIVRRVLRAPDGREIVKRVRQVRKLTAGATDGEVTPGRRIRAPLIPLAEGIPLARLTPSAQQDLLPALKQDHPAAVRQFHMLWNKIDTISMQEPACTIIVTSAVPKEGKSVCSINLAATIAQTPDVRVLLMDADLHQPRTHEYLGLELPEKGLADILRGQATVADCVINYEIDRFYYLPSGVTEGMPTELLAGRAMDHLLDELKGLFHFVIIDSPPLVPIADTVNLAAKVDGVVLVVRAGQTSRKLVGQVLEDLGEKRILGVVLNGLDFRTSGGAYHYGYYGYYGYYGGYGKRAAARE